MQTCASATTIAFSGLEARPVEVQVQLAGGQPGMVIVGLGDKAVSEARERVRAAFASIGLAIPAGRMVVNLAPADLPKEGSHYDVPIALAMMAAIGTLKVARTIADLDGADGVRRIHVAEALSLKRQWAGAEAGAMARMA
jgi:magnesium chelatase family protein